MYSIQHTHKLSTIELLLQPPFLSVSENGYERIWSQSIFPFCSENMDKVPMGQIWSCILRVHRLCGIRESPWGQRPGLGLETLLLETEVLGVDLSIWASTMGFCTYRKRWQSLNSSPCRAALSAQLCTQVLFLAEAPVVCTEYGCVKYWTKSF